MRGRRDRGFTLIEIVVALAVLGVGLIVIIELFSGGLRLGRVSQEYTQAVAYGRLKMEDISLSREMKEGLEEGEFDKKFRWRLEVKKVDILPIEEGTDLALPVDLYEIKLHVIWQSGTKERAALIESMKAIQGTRS